MKPDLTISTIELMDQEPIRNSYTQTVEKVWRVSPPEAIAIYERELRHYKTILRASNYLQQCTAISLISVFLDAALNGLSLRQGSKSECYIEARSSQQTIEGKNVWVKLATLAVTAYGELTIRIRCGHIIRANNPVVIYQGDTFQPMTNERGEMTVKYIPIIPRTSNNIVGAFVSLVLPDGGIDFKWLLMDDILRLADKSKPKATQDNPNPKPNALYLSNDGQIDPGFLEAKVIKHAFRSMPKTPIYGSALSEEEIEEMKEVEPEQTSHHPQQTPLPAYRKANDAGF